LKKRTKKLFLIGARGAAALMLREQKFFGSFFQKRTACLVPPAEARLCVNHEGGWYNTSPRKE
jgi:hypothetical protein